MSTVVLISTRLEKALSNFLAFLMAAMVIDVLWQVISRFALADPSSYTEELARFLLMWVGLLGAAYAYRKHSHLSLDLVIKSVSPSNQIRLNRFIQCVTFMFALSVMVFGGYKLMALTLSLKQNSAALGLPMGWVYACIPISGLFICWFAFDNFIHAGSHSENNNNSKV